MTPKQEVDALLTVLLAIIESADNTGCSGEITVVSAKAVDRGRKLCLSLMNKS